MGAGRTIGDILKQRAALRGYRRAEILLKGVFFPRRGILRASWRGKKCSGGGGRGSRVGTVGARGEGSERRWGEGGPQKGLRVRDGGEGEKVRCTCLDEDRVPNNRGTFFFFSTTSTTSRQYILHRPPCIVSQCMQLYLCIRILCAAMFRGHHA